MLQLNALRRCRGFPLIGLIAVVALDWSMNLHIKREKVSLHRLPNQVQIDVKVTMGHAVMDSVDH